jgi:hypothetical protein
MMAAGQKGAGIALDIQAAVTADPIFGEWAAGMLGVIGKEEQVAQQVQAPAQLAYGGMEMANNGLLEQVLIQQNQILMQQTAEAARVQAAERAKKSETKDPYTQYELAKLMGWAHVDAVEDLPPIWADFLSSKATDVHKTLIKERLQQWSNQAGIKIDPGLWLTKDQVKDIVEMKFSPGGMVGLRSMAEMGLSNLGALPRTHAEIAAIKAYEEREQKAQATMTIADYTKKNAVRSKITPPANYNELQANIGTTLGLVAITCGPRRGAFQKLLELYQVLQGGYVQAIHKIVYSPRRCREYSWAVYEAMREYFSIKLTPDKFSS